MKTGSRTPSRITRPTRCMIKSVLGFRRGHREMATSGNTDMSTRGKYLVYILRNYAHALFMNQAPSIVPYDIPK